MTHRWEDLAIVMPAITKPQIVSIQYLRAFAALLVVFQHTREQIPLYDDFLTFSAGGSGVDLFFVISGLVMCVTATHITAADFMAKRIIRVVPLYWFFTCVLAGLALFAPTLFRTTVVSVNTFIMSLFFIPHFSLGHPGKVWPILVPGWTLTYEMFFYITFAVFTWLSIGIRIGIITLFFTILVIFGSVFSLSETELRPFTSPLLFEFVAGMAIGYHFLYCKPAPVFASTLLLILGSCLFMLQVLPGDRVFTSGIPAALIVFSAVHLEQKNVFVHIKFLRLLGDASYSIYLSHLFTLYALRFAWDKAGLAHHTAVSAYAFASTAMACVALISVGVYYKIEQPLLRVARKLYRWLWSKTDVITTRLVKQNR